MAAGRRDGEQQPPVIDVVVADNRTATLRTLRTRTLTAVSDTKVVTATSVRPSRAGEARDVRRIFRDTLLLGRPLPIDGGFLYAYESLCLDWHLTNGTVLVAVEDGRVRGYLLACLDQARYERWATRRAVRWAQRALTQIALGELRGDARRFVLLRIRDGLDAWRHAPPAPFGAHAHLNLDASVRDAGIGHRLAAAMDELVATAGLDGWFGELNVPEGRSLGAIEAAGAVVVHRQRNHTFSWLLGQPVDRATIARPLATRTGIVRRRGADVPAVS